MDRAALGRRALSPAPLDGAHAGGHGRRVVLRDCGYLEPDLHRRGGLLRAGRTAAAYRRGQSVPAPCLDQPDHVGVAAALFLPAESVAQAGAGRVACAYRVVAGAYSSALSLQQSEQHRQSGGDRPVQGRAGGARPLRLVPRQPGQARQFGAMARRAGAGATIFID